MFYHKSPFYFILFQNNGQTYAILQPKSNLILMIDIEKVKEIILSRTHEHYAPNLRPLDGMGFLPCLQESGILDAYIGTDKSFRLSIYLHQGEWDEDKQTEILQEVQLWCGMHPEHFIFLIEVGDEENYPWSEDEMITIDNCNGFWTFNVENERPDLDYVLKTMFNILDGFEWKLSCRVGKNEGLILLLKQETCPHCGQIVWIPDYLAMTILKPTTLSRKPILLSLQSIHNYSDDVYEQIRQLLLHKHKGLCLPSERKNHCFHVDCPSCSKEVIQFNAADAEYYQFECGPTWYDWCNADTVPKNIKLLSIPDINLNLNDVEQMNSSYTAGEGFASFGTYSIDEFIHSEFGTRRLDRCLSNQYIIRRHLNTHPAFRLKLKPCDTEFRILLARRILETYQSTVMKAVESFLKKLKKK